MIAWGTEDAKSSLNVQIGDEMQTLYCDDRGNDAEWGGNAKTSIVFTAEDEEDDLVITITTEEIQEGEKDEGKQGAALRYIALSEQIRAEEGGSLEASAGDLVSGTLNSTELGGTDWVYWGNGQTEPIDRKNVEKPIISDLNFTKGGNEKSTLEYGWGNWGYAVTWTDGKNGAASQHDRNGLLLAGDPDTSWAQTQSGDAAAGSELAFSVPATQEEQTLTIVAGSYGATGKMTASLEKDGNVAVQVTELRNSSGVKNGVVRIKFSSQVPDDKLNIQYELTGR